MSIRQPFSKLHLANSSEPLKLGTTLEALCLKEIPYAQAKFMWDSSQRSFKNSRGRNPSPLWTSIIVQLPSGSIHNEQVFKIG